MSIPVASAVPPPAASPTPASAMPAYRLAHFRARVGERLRAGATPEQLIREQQALMGAIANPAFLMAAAVVFAHEMKREQPNPEYTIAKEEAVQEIAGIFKRRTDDAQQFIALLSDPAFVAQVKQTVEPLPDPCALPAEKAADIVRMLTHDGQEPDVHVAASAMGQRQVHQALANLFKPEGPLRAILVHQLAQAWPEAQAGVLETLAGEWLKARHDSAHTVANGLKPGAALYNQAMAQATGRVAVALPAQPMQPAPRMIAPVMQHEKPIAAASTLQMDAL